MNRLALALVIATSCASPRYVQAPAYPQYPQLTPPPPSLPAAQARERAAELSSLSNIADDLDNLIEETCETLAQSDAGPLPYECVR